MKGDPGLPLTLGFIARPAGGDAAGHVRRVGGVARCCFLDHDQVLHRVSQGYASLHTLLILTDAIAFRYPQTTAHIGQLARLDDESQCAFQQRKPEPAWQPNDDDASELARRVSQRIREISVERDKASFLGRALPSEVRIWRREQVLVRDRGNIEPCSLQKHGAHRAEVLVKLDLHATSRPVTTIRSRVISAAYAMHARTSSASSPGYCSRIWSLVIPSARRSTMSDTQMR